MLKLLLLSTVQALLLASSQVFLKLAFGRMPAFEFRWSYFGQLLSNWQFALSGLTIAGASVLWFYIVRHFPLSVAYPLISISYVFGMVAAVVVFGESVPASRWIGVGLIAAGVFFMVKQ